MGIKWTKWFEAEAGVRRSKILKWESDETEEMTEADRGANAALYVQEWVGKVSIELGLTGDHCRNMLVSFFLFHLIP